MKWSDMSEKQKDMARANGRAFRKRQNQTKEGQLANRARARDWAKKNPDRVRVNKRRHAEKHAARIKEKRRAIYVGNRDEIRTRSAENRLKRKKADPFGFSMKVFFQHQLRVYGLSRESWERIFESQNRCCGCCSTETPGGRNRWHTDHDHVTGKVRGILCYRCNVMIGFAKENQERLRSGAAYLERTK